MITERIVGPDGCIIFDIYETDYFQDIPNMENEDAQFFEKEKGQEEEFSRHHQLLLSTM